MNTINLNKTSKYMLAIIVVAVLIVSSQAAFGMCICDAIKAIFSSRSPSIIEVIRNQQLSQEKRVKRVKEILACKTKKGKIELVNKTDKDGITPLYWACVYNNLEMVKLLLSYCSKETINKADEDGWTPLYRACLDNNPEIVELLLKWGAQGFINKTHKYGYTPLHLAFLKVDNSINSDDLEIARLLLVSGAQKFINKADNRNRPPLYYVCSRKNNPKIVELFLEWGTQIDDESLEKVKKNLKDKTKKATAAQILNTFKLTQYFDSYKKTGAYFSVPENQKNNKDLCKFADNLLKSKRAEMLDQNRSIFNSKGTERGKESYLDTRIKTYN